MLIENYGILPEWIFLNIVTTLDGKITTRDGAGSKFASQADAIIIGARTAISDNPTLDLPAEYRTNQLRFG